jgi:hypothetical protein
MSLRAWLDQEIDIKPWHVVLFAAALFAVGFVVAAFVLY